MSEQNIKLASTVFYIGYFPAAPGTVASLAGAMGYVVLHQHLVWYLLILAGVIYLGYTTGGQMEKICHQKDPGCIVIDEVAGVLIAYFLLPCTWPIFITTFFLFRAFDMFKIYPANKLEGLGGASGIMMDDMIAGVYTNLIMQVAVRWAGIFY